MSGLFGSKPPPAPTGEDRAKAAEEARRRLLAAQGRQSTVLGGKVGELVPQKRLLGS